MPGNCMINTARLTPPVQKLLSSSSAQVGDWQQTELHGGLGSGKHIYRLAGSALDRGKTVAWSLVLKVIPIAPGDESPHEAVVYQSGMLDNLPSSLHAPRCFGVAQPSPNSFWIWLQDLGDESEERWSLQRYAVVARHLGEFNGIYLAGKLLPPPALLTSGWLRSWVGRAGPGIARLAEMREHPLVRQVYPADAVDDLLRLWAERDTLLDALDLLPQTLCHFDAHRRNLFVRHVADGKTQTVAIDWQLVGIGAIGVEIAPVVTANLMFWEVELEQAQALDTLVFENYLEGLGGAGWHGDPRVVRFGYTAAAALRYGVGSTRILLPLLLDPVHHAWLEQITGHPVDDLLQRAGHVTHFVGGLATEARELLATLR